MEVSKHYDGTANLGESIGGQFQRWFDPTSVSMQFNSAEALKNREFQASEAEKMRSFNSAEALKNREFQERMSNTSYQRARDDMIKAGLNPYLMYGSGGASSPSGSSASGGMASGSSASVGSGQNALIPLFSLLSHGVSSAFGLAQQSVDALEKTRVNDTVRGLNSAKSDYYEAMTRESRAREAFYNRSKWH